MPPVFAGGKTITDAFALKAVHKSISTVGINYAGGGTTVGITYQEKAGTSAAGDNLNRIRFYGDFTNNHS